MKLALIIVAMLTAQARAYITSATFEYSVDDRAKLYLNGRLVVEDTGPHYPDYAVLSSSDGTLPLEAFALNGDNVLAVENLDPSGGSMSISYRLTVHHSSGDPVVIWGLPEETRMLHLSKDGQAPEGWFLPRFDDSKWQMGQKTVYGTTWYTYPEILDPAFGSLGFQGVLPHISHSGNGHSSPGDRNLCRNHFSFPYTPGKTRLLINPASARAGQTVALRLLPAGDASDIGAFKLYADLPAGLDLVSAPGAAIFDREKRRVGWNFAAASSSVRFLTLTSESVVSAGGWEKPERVLGGYKPNHPTGWNHPNIPEDLYLEAAAFFPGMPACFKLKNPEATSTQAYPVILGVVFHNQMLSGGQNTATVKDVDDMMFNYSVSPDGRKALKKDVWVSRVSNSNAWYDGYYDATEDRAWTWADVQNLKLYFEAKTRRNPDKNRLASAYAVVKCFRPQDTSPVFYAKVSEAGCKKLGIQAGIYSPRFKAPASDEVLLPVNPEYCPKPTPVPTVSIMISAEAKPTPSADSGLKPGLEVLGLSCFSNSPEPFSYGGTFIRFCLKKPADVTLKIYLSGSTPIREIKGGSFRAGDSQIFFNGLDAQDKPLKPGSYTYELYAQDSQYKAQRQGSMSRGSDKRH